MSTRVSKDSSHTLELLTVIINVPGPTLQQTQSGWLGIWNALNERLHIVTVAIGEVCDSISALLVQRLEVFRSVHGDQEAVRLMHTHAGSR